MCAILKIEKPWTRSVPGSSIEYPAATHSAVHWKIHNLSFVKHGETFCLARRTRFYKHANDYFHPYSILSNLELIAAKTEPVQICCILKLLVTIIFAVGFAL